MPHRYRRRGRSVHSKRTIAKTMGFRKSKAELEKAKQIYPVIYARIRRVEVFTNLFNILSLVQSVKVQTLESMPP